MSGPGGRRVVVVTGGGGGIGAAVAEALGRAGAHVVTMDPLVTSDGSAPMPAPEETTAGRIQATGGSAQASTASVTDAEGVEALLADVVAEHGRLDGVVNVAGITRPTSFARGDEADWAGVLSVHLDGYLNVLRAALPIMEAAGHGRVLGVTSGSGWRPADTGAYGCAKRAVAALTWQLGPVAPAGVAVNAMSPIAVTRMVTEALARVQAAGPAPGARPSSTGGLSLGSMPEPAELGPFAAHLVGEGFGWCRGQVLFAGGPEVAVIDPPRLLEVVRSDADASLEAVLEAVVAGGLVPAHEAQISQGATNPRFVDAFAATTGGAPTAPPTGGRRCAVVSDRPDVAAAVTAAVEGRGLTCVPVEGRAGAGFAAAAAALDRAADGAGPLDAVVVGLAGAAGDGRAGGGPGWARVLDEHAGLPAGIVDDGAWARAAADHARAADRPLRLVVLTDATSAGGRSRAQASAQLCRSGATATKGRVAAFAVALESGEVADLRAAGGLAAHLVADAGAAALAGAELAVGPGWLGLRSHPRPGGSVVLGGPDVPAWLDDVLRSIVGGGGVAAPPDR